MRRSPVPNKEYQQKEYISNRSINGENNNTMNINLSIDKKQNEFFPKSVKSKEKKSLFEGKGKRLKKLSKLIKTKKIRKKQKNLVHSPQIKKLKQCNSKIQLRRIILKLTPEWKKIIKFYMTECFIHDLYTRRLENKMFLLSKRELLYRLIDNPELLNLDCHFDNNLLKNYCTGIANFVIKHHQDIKEILEVQI
jgi:hypothetical protein